MARSSSTWDPKTNPRNQYKGLSEEEKLARLASRHEIAVVWLEIKGMTLTNLNKLYKDPNIPAVKLAMIASMLNAATKGELKDLYKYYELLIGKPKETHHVTSDGSIERLQSIFIEEIANEAKRKRTKRKISKRKKPEKRKEVSKNRKP